MTDFELQKTGGGITGPLVLVILDGFGIYKGAEDGYPGNAVDLANAPTLKRLLKEAPVHTLIKAHGTAVGLPSDGDSKYECVYGD